MEGEQKKEEIVKEEEKISESVDLSSEVLKKRKEKLLNFFEKSPYTSWITYPILILILWLGAFIRTRNVSHLQEKWLLALDPYVFYRYAGYILENGKLMTIDFMRGYPLGVETAKISNFLAYVIAYMHKFFTIFSKNLTLWWTTAMYPVIFFVLAIIVFFFLMKRLCDYRVALFSAAFLAVIPSFLYRTMVGFSDKEALGIFLMFLTFYFFVVGWQVKSNKSKLIFGIFSGLTTALMGLTWGGVSFISLIVPTFIFIEVLFNKLKKGDFLLYTGWIALFFIVLSRFTLKYGGIKGMMGSWTFNLALLVWIIALFSFVLPKVKFFKRFTSKFKNLPANIWYILFSFVVVLIIVLITYGPSFLYNQIYNVIDTFLIHPAGVSRFQLTVAEGHQPYFTTWIGQFGWLFFWLFFAGSILLFWELVKPLVKHKIKLTGVYLIFISGFIFSRYSSSSLFNGENFISRFIYAGSFIFFVLASLFIYFKTYRHDKETYLEFSKLNKKFIFLFVWFILMVVAGRTAIRLMFVFSPAACFMSSYALIYIYDWSKKNKEKIYKYLSLVAILLICYLTLFSFAKESYNQAKYTGPSYNAQWQNAGEWVTENIQEDAVFAHWWDYGYWVQTNFGKATVTDGGNAIGYWNHLLGRHFLTGQTTDEALEFLKTHEVTHTLMISDEIGKYGAYSSIGGDENNDRLSYIPSFGMDQSAIQETRNGFALLYTGGFGIDEDFIYQGNLIPQGEAYVAGVLLEIDNSNNVTTIKQPSALLIYKGNQFKLTLGCVWIEGMKYSYADADMGACFRIVPTVDVGSGQVNNLGAGLFVSEKVSRTIFARLFLFDETLEGFNLIYDDSTTMPLSIVNGRIVGPLRIWEMNYPSRIQSNPAYLETEYPDERLDKLN